MRATVFVGMAVILGVVAILVYPPLREEVLGAVNAARDSGVAAIGGCSSRPWTVRDFQDPISGEKKFEAATEACADNNGRHGTFEVTASCDAASLAFKIVYHSDFDKELGYLMQPATGLLREPHPVMRLALDGQAGSAPSVNTPFKNEATLYFQRNLTEEEKGNLGTLIFGGLTSLLSAATPSQVFGANLLKVEMPLNNGDLPILEIRPQDSGFKRFAERCNTVKPKGASKSDGSGDQTSATSSELPTQVGDCVNTTIESVGFRLDGDPDSGSSVTFKNGASQVGYDTDPSIADSMKGDPVRICLVSIPKNCPPRDQRGRVYRTANLRTLKSWERADSSYACGGA